MMWDWIDEEFADIKDVVFFNAPYVVMPPKSVQSAFFGFYKDHIARFGDDTVPIGWKMVEETRADFAGLIGAEASEIAFTKNTTEGIGIVANGLSFCQGANVVVVDQEHTSLLNAWIQLQRKGVELRVVKSCAGLFTTDDIIAACDKKTAVIAISAVQFTTGVYADLASLGEYCRNNGIKFIVDVMQAIGRLHIDVNRMGIDYLACGGNKGLLAVLGAGAVYCHHNFTEQIVPTYAGYQSVVNHAKPPAITEDFSHLQWHNDARRFEAGNPNYAGIAAIQAGVRVLQRAGTKNIEQHVLALEDRVRSGIEGLPLHVQLIPDSKNRSGIVCVYYPADKEDKVVDILREHKIHATMRGGYIRIGFHLYNKSTHVDTAISAFQRIAKL
jgi:selenocysteine lyase/cysteine desulfurase